MFVITCDGQYVLMMRGGTILPVDVEYTDSVDAAWSWPTSKEAYAYLRERGFTPNANGYYVVAR